MSAETLCPQCQRALPSTVITGPAQAVVRCEGCSALLLWSNGRVVRAAKPSGNAPPAPRSTMQGMTAAPQPAMPKAPAPTRAPEPPRAEPTRTDAVTLQPLTPGAPPVEDEDDDVTRIDGVNPDEPPLSSLRPEGDEASKRGPTLARIETKKEPARTVLGMPSPVLPASLTPPAPGKDSGPIAVKKDQPSAPIAVKSSSSGKIELGKPPAVPPRRDPSAPINVKGAASGKIELGKPPVMSKKDQSAPIAVKKDATGPVPKSDAPRQELKKDGSKPHVVAAVAEVKVDAAGPMVNPTEWFVDQPTTGKGQTVPRSEETGPVALPPPPGPVDSGPVALPPSPFSNETTPPLGTKVPAAAPATAPVATSPVAASASASPPPAAAAPPAAAPPAAAAPAAAAAPPAATAPAAAPPAATPPPPGSRPATMMGLSDETKPAGEARKGGLFTEAASSAPVSSAPPPDGPQSSSPRPSTSAAPPPRMTQPMGSVKPTPPKDDDELPPLAEPKHSTIRMGASAPPASPPPAAPPPPATASSVSSGNVPPPSPGPTTPDWVVNVPPTGEQPAALPPAPHTPAMGAPRMSEPPRPSRARGSNKKLMIWAGGGVGALLLIGGLVFALTRAPSPQVKAPPPPEPEKVVVQPPEPTPTPAPAPKPPEPEKVAARREPEPEPEKTGAVPSGDEHARPRGKTLGGKKVVLEYDPKPTAPEPPPATAPVPAGEDPNTLARARESYHRGNQKLFSGDTDGAVTMYRESLRIYPGYVAGYRGLGLAYAEQGNANDALSAFKKYIGTVPNARDVPLIRKRMDHLMGKPSAP